MPENRGDDPKTDFDPNYSRDENDEGVMTPRSLFLSGLKGAEHPDTIKSELDRLHEESGNSIKTLWELSSHGKYIKKQ